MIQKKLIETEDIQNKFLFRINSERWAKVFQITHTSNLNISMVKM